ncbi:hypothetical protein A5731_18835 [Mycolicibacterium conceptionense]|uniref:DUF559 domain-containing protein n=1 Tax=Mycolicibacterium conceptionense TaxID=451644 RepID=A0A1A2V480_9MYCO|nr:MULTISPECIES: hypothetical protein [Mycolicibacterium]MCW1820581.1 hypothetical protein [Mycolicibacterium senegalense]OBB15694.1 hypothetical protein A5718_29345 [Mycolicibacterium conceptionense]OBF01196.1 hypothetical protein A5731_18835 [Mycolicibacterium conceptionense]OBF17116.1 hypothetical protein A5726_00690 [Mycolicibacterium conceptionense]OBF39302.1 hypothetical protein A5720_18035 [Mycolicibacterium conceptionense]
MGEPFVGSKAVANGELLKSALRTHYTRVFRDVYVSPGTELTPVIRAQAAWLWSRQRGIIAGNSAAAVHGAKWVDPKSPVEMIHSNRNPLVGLRIRTEAIEEDEIVRFGGVPVTSLARTALEIGSWYPRDDAVAALDALARATDLKVADVELLTQRYARRRGIQRARTALNLMDSGAQSPKETWLRLILIDGGLPRPQTQIPVFDAPGDPFAYLDMGWEDIKVAAEYDGEEHRASSWRYGWDLRRAERIQRQGWINVRVSAGESPDNVLRRVVAARAQRLSR